MRAREVVSAAWDSALARAVPTSSVKPARRPSVSGGSCSSRVEAALMTPHSLSSTLIGAPTAERKPQSWATSAAGPVASP